MRREDVAWDHLTDIQRAQMIHFYPELAEDKHKKGGKAEKIKACQLPERAWKSR